MTTDVLHSWARDAQDELDRLKRGDFTENEFQNLCHQFEDKDVYKFANGCVEYMNKLFGQCPLHIKHK